MKNLKFSSMHEGIVNTDDQVITCDKHSTEVEDKHEEAITQKLIHSKATEHLHALQHFVAGTPRVPEQLQNIF